MRCALGLSCDLGEALILKQRDQATATPKRGSSSFTEKEKMIVSSFRLESLPVHFVLVFFRLHVSIM